MRKFRIDKVINDLRGKPLNFGKKLDEETGEFSDGTKTTGEYAIVIIENAMGQSKDGVTRLGMAAQSILKALDAGKSFAALENAEYGALKKAITDISDKLRNQVPITLAYNEVFDESDRLYERKEEPENVTPKE